MLKCCFAVFQGNVPPASCLSQLGPKRAFSGKQKAKISARNLPNFAQNTQICGLKMSDEERDIDIESDDGQMS
jgi:hypothetical protein